MLDEQLHFFIRKTFLSEKTNTSLAPTLHCGQNRNVKLYNTVKQGYQVGAGPVPGDPISKNPSC